MKACHTQIDSGVLSLFVRHGVDKSTGAHDTLKEYYSTRLPDTDVTTVILD